MLGDPLASSTVTLREVGKSEVEEQLARQGPSSLLFFEDQPDPLRSQSLSLLRGGAHTLSTANTVPHLISDLGGLEVLPPCHFVPLPAPRQVVTALVSQCDRLVFNVRVW